MQAALEYASKGWHVFPVEPQGKRPLVTWKESSTSDEDTIRKWWTDWPYANVGIDCGKSGLVVIDIDDMDAVPALAEKLSFDPTSDDTAVAKTGGGGMHVYYRAGSNEIRNSASKVLSGVDVRGVGGFVVAPPSSHESGHDYEWVSDKDPKPIPERVVSVINYREERVAPEPTPARSHEKWGIAILAGEAADVESAPPGQRNDQLFMSALAVFSAVKGGHLDKSIAYARMHEAALHVGLGEQETVNTLRSAWETAQPRHPEEKLPPVSPMRGNVSPQKPFRTLSIDDLDRLPPPEWLLPYRLPEGQTWMYGEPGSGKTFLALDWAASVATSGLNVLYFVGEGVSGFARRVKSWRDYYKKDLSSFMVIPQAPHLLQHDSVEMLRETVMVYSPSLIVVDTFARASVGGDENSARDVGMAIDALDTLWREHKVSSLVIHHSNKSGGVERGSSAIRGAADATWEVQPGIEGDKYLGATAFCRKMKDAEPPQPVIFQLRQYSESAFVYPSASTL